MLSGLRRGVISPGDLLFARYGRSLASGSKRGVASSGDLIRKKRFLKDPFFNNVIFLSHFDGVNNSNTFIDIKGNTINAAGSPLISTAQFKFSGASLFLNGSSYLTVANSGSLSNFSTIDFTIECWVYRIGTSGAIISKWPTSGSAPSGCYSLYLGSSTRIQFYWSAFSEATPLLVSTTTLVANTWYYVAVTKQNTSFSLYINGVLENNVTTVNAANNTSNLLDIGSQSGAFFFNGYLDDVRLTKNFARTIVLPTAPFSDN